MKSLLRDKMRELGSLTWHEAVVTIDFLVLVALWFFRDPDFMVGWAPAISPGGQGYVKVGEKYNKRKQENISNQIFKTRSNKLKVLNKRNQTNATNPNIPSFSMFCKFCRFCFVGVLFSSFDLLGMDWKVWFGRFDLLCLEVRLGRFVYGRLVWCALFGRLLLVG